MMNLCSMTFHANLVFLSKLDRDTFFTANEKFFQLGNHFEQSGLRFPKAS